MMLKAMLAVGLLAGLLIVGAAPASATTFCVPSFSAACTDSGSNVAKANLETAASTSGSDGFPDRVILGATTYTDPDTFEPQGTDPLTIDGAGVGQTRITSSSSENRFVVSLADRPTSMSGLTIVIPASFPDAGGNGAALQTESSTFDHVNIESRNPDSDAVASAIRNNTFRDCRIYGAAGGTVADGFRPNEAAGEGTLNVIRTTIRGARTAINAGTEEVRVFVRQSRLMEASVVAVEVNNGGRVDIENTLIRGNKPAVVMFASNGVGEEDSSVAIKSSTIVTAGDTTNRPLQIVIDSVPGSRWATMTVADSIIRGFDNTWYIDAPAGPGLGVASLKLTDSNFLRQGVPADSPSVNFSDPGNINRNPLFIGSGSYRLKAGSPSIDAAANDLNRPRLDLDGRHRPLDGDGNGTAIRDQGAYESPDTRAPKITRLKAKSLKRGKLRIRFRSSEPAKVIYAFKPTPKKSNGKRRKDLVVRKKAKRGPNVLVVKGGRLSKGRYRVRIIATDSSANISQKIVAARVKGR